MHAGFLLILVPVNVFLVCTLCLCGIPGLWAFCCKKKNKFIFLVFMSWSTEIRRGLTPTAPVLFNSFPVLSFSFPSQCCLPLLLFSFPSLLEGTHMQSQVNTLICGRNLSHPLPFLSHSLLTAYVGHHDSLLYASKAGSLLSSSILSPLTFVVV